MLTYILDMWKIPYKMFIEDGRKPEYVTYVQMRFVYMSHLL